MKSKKTNNLFLYLIFPALMLRLVFASLFFHPDIKKFHYQVQFLASGVINVYDYIDKHKAELPNSDTFNYFPGNYYLLGFWNIISRTIIGSPFVSWLNDWGPNAYFHPRMFEFLLILKFPYLVFDFLVCFMLLKLTYKQLAVSHKLLILWLFNPISLYAIYMLGQIDIIPACLTVGALLLTQNKKPVPAVLLLGLGAAIKTYPLLLMPFVLIRVKDSKQAIYAISAFLAAFIIPMLPVISSSVFRTTMAQSNLTQYIFYAGFPVSASQYIPLYVLIWGLVFWLSWHRRHNFNVLPEFLTLTLAVTLMSHFHAQWIIWSLPFIVLFLAKNFRYWPLAVSMAAGYFGTVFLIPDQFVFLGLLSQINPQAVIFPPITQFVSDPAFIQSLFHTVLAASGIWFIYFVWKNNEV